MDGRDLRHFRTEFRADAYFVTTHRRDGLRASTESVCAPKS